MEDNKTITVSIAINGTVIACRNARNIRTIKEDYCEHCGQENSVKRGRN